MLAWRGCPPLPMFSFSMGFLRVTVLQPCPRGYPGSGCGSAPSTSHQPQPQTNRNRNQAEASSFPSTQPQADGEHPPCSPKSCRKCKEKEKGNTQRALYASLGKTSGISHLQTFTSPSAVGILPKPVTLHPTGGRGGGRQAAAGC